ncbi:MAG TPA: tRNA (N6-isopentenyl adenosine(37)-C2)-methylthiotransferase MiaB [Hyphomicrobiaceae bacterium]|nr:tRNA (N6-isopentenyl adenosine(37)-C2)-methylthiotransferase MiaB [Hyphomicrobiaceae bacterium]
MTKPRKIHIKTFGCQMNVYDSERIAELLAPQGFAETATAEDADVIVLNTCHIREKAAEKVYSDLGRLREIKAERRLAGKETTIAVAGCVAQAEGEEIVRRMPSVDVVVGPQSYHELGHLLARARAEQRPMVETAFPEVEKFASLPARNGAAGPVTAFLTVQEGCDKFCTFCVVPYTRGAEYSRAVADVEAEARRLVERGVRELTLLGQNVNAYHGAGPDGGAWSLAGLIRRLALIEGLERLRYTTSHPRDMGDDLIAAHRDEPKLMPFLHLPFQSGSDRILAAMNRKHTRADYLALVARIRAARPDIALSTDIIVGFPGETESDVQDTLAVLDEVGFAQAYAFKYSPRPGTPAAKAEVQLPEEAKDSRLQRVLEAVTKSQTSFNCAHVGTVIPVLFERPGRHAGQLVGRSPYMQAVHVGAELSLCGHVVAVEIVAAGANSLSGKLAATA